MFPRIGDEVIVDGIGGCGIFKDVTYEQTKPYSGSSV